MKLHLGCGQVYLDGYVNIDYPSSQQNLTLNRKPDKYADILNLQYKKNSIEEIRLHHVFEHFPRHIAIALMVSWRSWLKPTGILRIEVPDFDRTCLDILNPTQPFSAKARAYRHIFGSNEASWAIHFEGWSKKKFEYLGKIFGFRTQSINYYHWNNTHNIDICMSKSSLNLTKKSTKDRTREYLSNYCIQLPSSPTEQELLVLWMKEFDEQISKSYAN